MREILAFIRPNKMGATRVALAEAGFPAFTCKACMGRGKEMLPTRPLEGVNAEAFSAPPEEILLMHSRLIAKRYLSLVVKDAEVKHAVDTIIDVNRTSKPGDGKIFVLPVTESYVVRTGEKME